MIRDVALVGPLADKYGHQPIQLDVDDVWSLFSGLECAYPGFRAQLSQYDELAFIKRRNGTLTAITEEQLGMRFGGADTIVVATRTRGSVESIAAWVVTALGATGTAATIVGAITYVAVSVAISYATSAVMKSLSDSPDPAQERDKRESRLFNGPQNIRTQGGGIAKLYGKHRVGATIISSEITSERLPMLMPDSFTFQAGETATRNVTDNDILRDRLTLTGWTIDGTTRAIGYTHTVAETVPPGPVDPLTNAPTYPGSNDAHSFSLAANGTLTVTSQPAVTKTYNLTYTATDSTDGSTMTTTATLAIRAVATWENVGGDSTGSTVGEGAGSGTASAGDGNAGDGGTGGGDGSGSGGGTGTA